MAVIIKLRAQSSLHLIVSCSEYFLYSVRWGQWVIACTVHCDSLMERPVVKTLKPLMLVPSESRRLYFFWAYKFMAKNWQICYCVV